MQKPKVVLLLSKNSGSIAIPNEDTRRGIALGKRGGVLGDEEEEEVECQQPSLATIASTMGRVRAL